MSDSPLHIAAEQCHQDNSSNSNEFNSPRVPTIPRHDKNTKSQKFKTSNNYQSNSNQSYESTNFSSQISATMKKNAQNEQSQMNDILQKVNNNINNDTPIDSNTLIPLQLILPGWYSKDISISPDEHFYALFTILPKYAVEGNPLVSNPDHYFVYNFVVNGVVADNNKRIKDYNIQPHSLIVAFPNFTSIQSLAAKTRDLQKEIDQKTQNGSSLGDPEIQKLIAECDTLKKMSQYIFAIRQKAMKHILYDKGYQYLLSDNQRFQREFQTMYDTITQERSRLMDQKQNKLKRDTIQIQKANALNFKSSSAINTAGSPISNFPRCPDVLNLPKTDIYPTVIPEQSLALPSSDPIPVSWE